MKVDVKGIFKRHCGGKARYISSDYQNRGEHNTIAVQFEIFPEKRKFNLDGVVHEPGGIAEIEAAVAKIADIAMNVRQHISVEA